MHFVGAFTLYPMLLNDPFPSIPCLNDHMYGCNLAKYLDVGDMDDHLETGLVLI